MTLTIRPDVIQGSDEWLTSRRGIVTASAVNQLVTVRTLTAIDHTCPSCAAGANDPCRSKIKDDPIKSLHPERTEFARSAGVTVIGAARNDTARNLTLSLVAERINGWTELTFVSDDMLRGIDDEPKARAHYAAHYYPVDEVGFMTEDRWGFTVGYSPDGLVSDDGLIEIKSRCPKVHLATILADEVPAENMAQLQCGLLVSGREWIDYVSYCGGMPLWVKRVLPQPDWFDAITEAVAMFEATAAQITATYHSSIAGLRPTERTLDLDITI